MRLLYIIPTSTWQHIIQYIWDLLVTKLVALVVVIQCVAVKCLDNPHNRHPQLALTGELWGVFHESISWLMYCLSHLCCMKYHVMLDLVVMIPDCIHGFEQDSSISGTSETYWCDYYINFITPLHMHSMAMDTSLYFTQRNIQNVPVVPQETSNLKDEPKQVAILKI